MAKTNSKFTRGSKAWAERQELLAKIKNRMLTPVDGSDDQQLAMRVSAGRRFDDLQVGVQ